MISNINKTILLLNFIRHKDSAISQTVQVVAVAPQKERYLFKIVAQFSLQF
jgi:hypothetical protein